VTLDNVTATVKIPPGTYSDASALATAVQSKINGTSDFSSLGSSIVVTNSGGVLSFTSQRYGSASNVAIGGNGSAGLVGSSPTATAGLDVAGTMDGIAFAGSGQTATGAAGSNADGLKLSITGGALGARGTLTLTRGIAASVNDTLTQFLDPTNGLLTAATDGLNQSIADLKTQEDAWGPRLDALRAQYTAQYNAMDALVASLNSTGSYLTQQITAIQNMTNGINSGK
jgi:flagellar hook-associated protein 2